VRLAYERTKQVEFIKTHKRSWAAGFSVTSLQGLHAKAGQNNFELVSGRNHLVLRKVQVFLNRIFTASRVVSTRKHVFKRREGNKYMISATVLLYQNSANYNNSKHE
jgi:hypothetical protein